MPENDLPGHFRVGSSPCLQAGLASSSLTPTLFLLWFLSSFCTLRLTDSHTVSWSLAPWQWQQGAMHRLQLSTAQGQKCYLCHLPGPLHCSLPGPLQPSILKPRSKRAPSAADPPPHGLICDSTDPRYPKVWQKEIYPGPSRKTTFQKLK